jgi:CelD/BcsL family acetyltransferase involved in cellulose biosynthesis
VTFEEWLQTRSSHFRERARKARRRFERAGGTRRHATPETLSDDVDTLMRLHAGRWETLGESNLVLRPQQTRELLVSAGRRLGVDRFRLMIHEIEGEPMCAYLSLAAGGELLGINGGWDERFSRMSPFLVHGSSLVEDAIERGDHRIDLGLGVQSYKLRLATGLDPVGWAIVIVPGRRMGLTAMRVAPMLTRHAARDLAKRALSEGQADRLRALRSTVVDRGGRGGARR